jgi:hypothetical protein
VKTFPDTFKKLKGSLPFSLKPAKGIYPQPVQSTSDPFKTLPYNIDSYSLIRGKIRDESLC